MRLGALAVAALTPVALFFAADVSADPDPPEELPPPAAEDLPAPPPDAGPPPEDAPPPPDEPAPWPFGMFPAAMVNPDPHPLPPGLAPENGMQVKTILVSRSVTETFPQVHSMIGVRPDSRRWHPNGLAVDIMIPNPGSSEGVALGDQIVDYALRNADRFGLQDAIWRGTYYTPAGPSGSGNGHYDHVHITTTGGGFPNGDEEYLSDDPPPPPPPEEQA